MSTGGSAGSVHRRARSTWMRPWWVTSSPANSARMTSTHSSRRALRSGFGGQRSPVTCSLDASPVPSAAHSRRGNISFSDGDRLGDDHRVVALAGRVDHAEGQVGGGQRRAEERPREARLALARAPGHEVVRGHRRREARALGVADGRRACGSGGSARASSGSRRVASAAHRSDRARSALSRPADRVRAGAWHRPARSSSCSPAGRAAAWSCSRASAPSPPSRTRVPTGSSTSRSATATTRGSRTSGSPSSSIPPRSATTSPTGARGTSTAPTAACSLLQPHLGHDDRDGLPDRDGRQPVAQRAADPRVRPRGARRASAPTPSTRSTTTPSSTSTARAGADLTIVTTEVDPEDAGPLRRRRRSRAAASPATTTSPTSPRARARGQRGLRLHARARCSTCSRRSPRRRTTTASTTSATTLLPRLVDAGGAASTATTATGATSAPSGLLGVATRTCSSSDPPIDLDDPRGRSSRAPIALRSSAHVAAGPAVEESMLAPGARVAGHGRALRDRPRGGRRGGRRRARLGPPARRRRARRRRRWSARSSTTASRSARGARSAGRAGRSRSSGCAPTVEAARGCPRARASRRSRTTSPGRPRRRPPAAGR